MNQEVPANIGEVISTVFESPANGGKLHIPFKRGPLCGESSASEEKALALYPPAHRSWCSNCVELWQQSTERIIEYHEEHHAVEK